MLLAGNHTSVCSCSKQLKRVAKEGFKVKLPSPGRRVVSASRYE